MKRILAVAVVTVLLAWSPILYLDYRFKQMRDLCCLPRAAGVTECMLLDVEVYNKVSGARGSIKFYGYSEKKSYSVRFDIH